MFTPYMHTPCKHGDGIHPSWKASSQLESTFATLAKEAVKLHLYEKTLRSIRWNFAKTKRIFIGWENRIPYMPRTIEFSRSRTILKAVNLNSSCKNVKVEKSTLTSLIIDYNLLL
jgi:hypothetical protein